MTAGERPTGRLSFPPLLADKIRQFACDFVITGGSGWIGQAVLEMLEAALGDEVGTRLSVFGSSDHPLELRSGRIVDCQQLHHISSLNDAPKFFVHCAFLTKDKLSNQSVESFVAANQKISDLVAEAIENSNARGIFTPSSGAVYKKNTKTLDNDLQNNAYGMMKLADERRFSTLAQAKRLPLAMPRLFNLSGPFINKLDLYALSYIIKTVLNGQPIALNAAHRVVRSYLHVADQVTLAFSMLLEPRQGDAPIFDAAGDEVVELGDLAAQIRTILGRPELAIERPAMVEGHDDVYVGDGTQMKAMMQGRGMRLIPLEDQIRDTADYMASL